MRKICKINSNRIDISYINFKHIMCAPATRHSLLFWHYLAGETKELKSKWLFSVADWMIDEFLLANK